MSTVGRGHRALFGPLAQAISKASQSVFRWTPATTFLAHAGTWLYGWDRTDLTVNSDGSGGAVADGGTVGRWTDRSGNGNHVSQATANLRAIARDGLVSCRTYYSSGAKKALLSNTATGTTFDRANFSGGAVLSLQGAADTNPCLAFATGAAGDKFVLCRGAASPNWPNYRFITVYDGTTLFNTGLKWSARKCVITWRSNASGLIVNVDGEEVTLSALSAAAMNGLFLGSFAFGAPNQTDYHEVVAFDADIGEGEMANLRAYLNRQASTSPINRNNRIFVIGDSISRAWYAEDGKGWAQRITNRPTHQWFNYAKDGAYAYDHGEGGTPDHRPAVLASDLATQGGAGENVAIVWAGYNDRQAAHKTAAQTETGLGAYCLTLRNAGFKVIVCTVPHEPAGADAAYNTLIRANWANYATALADLRAAAALSNSADTTYFANGPHLTAAGMAVAASVIQAQMVLV